MWRSITVPQSCFQLINSLLSLLQGRLRLVDFLLYPIHLPLNSCMERCVECMDSLLKMVRWMAKLGVKDSELLSRLR